MSLRDWLLQQIAEDERIARAATPGPWCAAPDPKDTLETRPLLVRQGTVPEETDWSPPIRTSAIAAFAAEWLDEAVDNAVHLAAWDPARVLAECDAKRRIVDLVDRQWTNGYDERPMPSDDVRLPAPWEEVLRLLALPYAARSGYDKRWRP